MTGRTAHRVPDVVDELTVAVVSFQTRELLRRCLASLRGHDGVAVWVVDNGSTDGSVAMARAEFPEVTVVEAGENLGFGRAVNLVAQRTASPWLVAANADVEAQPGALERLVAAAGPQTGAVAPRLVVPDGSTQHSAFPFPTLGSTALFTAGLARLAPQRCFPGRLPRERAVVPWAIGAFLLLRREAFDAVGGFDERQWLYAEDLDLGWRLHRAGWETVYEPAAVVLHAESAATRAAWGEARRDRWQRATYEHVARRRGVAYARAVAALNVAGALARAPVQRRTALAWARVHARTGLGRYDPTHR